MSYVKRDVSHYWITLLRASAAFSRSVSLVSLLMAGMVLTGCTFSPATPSSSASPTTMPSPADSVLSSIPSVGQSLPLQAQMTIGEQTVLLEVAQTPEQQAIGLMFRKDLAADRGMLFSFNSARRVGFWMQNVLIPLDMIFLRDGKVQAISSNVPPCTTEPCPVYGPPVPVDQVIELRGRRAAELGIRVGDRLIIQPRTEQSE